MVSPKSRLQSQSAPGERVPGTDKDAQDKAAHAGIRSWKLMFSGYPYSNVWRWKHSHYSNEDHLLPHKMCLKIVPSEVWSFKIIKFIYEKVQGEAKNLKENKPEQWGHKEGWESGHHCCMLPPHKKRAVFRCERHVLSHLSHTEQREVWILAASGNRRCLKPSPFAGKETGVEYDTLAAR